uniref:non-specific serine/threonine protein kinase n=1 Tax=Aegilops tauschii TaxID=37682 RepID=N1R0I3_AEGTA
MGPGAIELTKNEIRDNLYSLGRASYVHPVTLWDNTTGEVASFSNFTFQIRFKNETDGQLRGLCGSGSTPNDGVADGMAFFLAHYPSRLPPNSVGGNLALFNDNNNLDATGADRVVAVEFDTFLNSWDHSDNHLGIDVNSINSKAYANVSKRLVSDDDVVMTAEISYENLTGVLVTLLQIDGDGPPYIVNTSVDMKRDLPQQVSVGFAASTGACIERHQVMSWSFRSTLDDATVVASTIPRRRPLVPVLVPSVVAAFLVLLCAAAVLGRRIWKKLDDSDDEAREQAEFERGVGPRWYRYRELAAATKDFAEGKLGRGGFGNVYRGDGLSDQDRPVAIKMLSAESSAQGRKEFESEVKIISRLRHRNLVHLLGWSDSREGLLLVYELVRKAAWTGTYTTRVACLLGQREWDQCVLHGDIKPSNILLDSSRNTKLADFGLARLVEHGAGPLTTQVVMGTVGYIDPEFIRTRRPSTEADVYSFGIVLLEVRRPEMGTGEPADKAIPLLRWIWDLYEKGAIVEAVDERLKGEDMQLNDVDICKGQMRRALVVGLWCTHPHPGARPSVVQLMNVLQSEDVTLPALSRPAPAEINTVSNGYNNASTSSVIACSDVSWASSGR